MIWATGSRARGFTLIELVVVLAILVGLAAAFPLAADRLRPERRLELYSEQIVTDLRGARSRAMVSGESVVLMLDRGGRSYRLQPGAEAQRLPGGLSLSTSDLVSPSEAESAAVQFRPDGSSSGGSLTLRRDQLSVAIEVSALTGRVKLHRD